jgi:hypothetical protein
MKRVLEGPDQEDFPLPQKEDPLGKSPRDDGNSRGAGITVDRD